MRRLLVLMLAATGCGDDGAHQLPDAPLPPDAAVDAAPVTPVAITISINGEPMSGIEVYFVNPDDTLVSKVTTDASGAASAVVLPGASVTVVDPFPAVPEGASSNRRRLMTYIGVKPGDELQLHQRFDRSYISANVSLPSHAGADLYVVDSTCSSPYYGGGGGSASTPAFNIYLEDCPATADFVVTALSNWTPIGWFQMANVPVSDSASLDFTSQTFETLPEETFTFENVPAEYAGLDYRTSLRNARGEVWEQDYSYVEVTNGTGTSPVLRPVLAGTSAITRAYLWPAKGGEHELLYWGGVDQTTFDLAGALLHGLTDAPEYDQATGTISWNIDATGATPDFSMAMVYVEADDGKSYAYYEWGVVAPYATSHVLPKLPDEVFPFPASDANYVDVWNARLAKVPGGYDAVRGRVFAIERVDELISGASGLISVAEHGGAKVRSTARAGKRQPQQRPAWAELTARDRRAANRR